MSNLSNDMQDLSLQIELELNARQHDVGLPYNINSPKVWEKKKTNFNFTKFWSYFRDLN